MKFSTLRALIREELGRDLKSPRPDMMGWRDFPGVHVMLTADPVNNCYYAKITVKDREDLSTSNRRFSSENDAMFWARDKAERAYRSLMNDQNYENKG